MRPISFITTHFAEFAWTELCVQKIRQNTDAATILEFLIVDQDRTTESKSRLLDLDPSREGVTIPEERETICSYWARPCCRTRGQSYMKHVASTSASSILMRTPSLQGGQSICEERLKDYDAIVAQDPLRPSSSHPCFMLLRQEQVGLSLAFDDLLFEEQCDTGRRIYHQLRNRGVRVFLAPAVRAFGGRYGYCYLDTIYHHAHGSFHKAGERFTTQINFKDGFFRNIVLNQQRYHLSPSEKLVYHLANYWLLMKIFSRLPGKHIRKLLRAR